MAKKLRKEKESVHFILFEFSNRIVQTNTEHFALAKRVIHSIMINANKIQFMEIECLESTKNRTFHSGFFYVFSLCSVFVCVLLTEPGANGNSLLLIEQFFSCLIKKRAHLSCNTTQFDRHFYMHKDIHVLFQKRLAAVTTCRF